MKFRTECEIPKSVVTIDFDKPIASVGSCFADNIAKRLRECMVNAQNPLGVLFNPLSIADALELVLLSDDKDSLFSKSIFSDHDLYHSWLFDSKFSSVSMDGCIEKFKINSALFYNIVEQSNVLLITFGTSFCYFSSSNEGKVVANCHKQHSSLFSRRRIGEDEILKRWKPLCEQIKAKFPNLELIFTVSPVRHIKDGLHENNLSKASLLLAVDSICRDYNYCHYFPAYELINDDLRDYRYYAEDLAHPSEQGIEYIWERFVDTYFEPQGRKLLHEGHELFTRLNHRPINKESAAYRRFMADTLRRYEEFKVLHPNCARPI